MKRKPEPTTDWCMECDRCGARMIIITLVNNAYPVKLPGQCPCCLAQILQYGPFTADGCIKGITHET